MSMFQMEHLSSACPCKAFSWALTGDPIRLADFQRRAMSARGSDLPVLRPWQPLLQTMCSAGAGGKPLQIGSAVPEDRSRQAQSQSAARRVSGRVGGEVETH